MHIDNEDKERRLINLRDASIDEVLPQYFAVRYPKFISLLQRYYEFNEDSSSPTILIDHLFSSRDINQTDITLLSYIEDELLLGNNWAFGLPDVRAAANFSNTLFRSKGTKYSIEWFFRSFFDLDPEIFYPKEDIFKIGESPIGAYSNKFLTDDKLYQTFAINIKSALPVSEWEDLYKLFVHPAGMYLGNTTLIVGEAAGTDSAEAFVTQRPSPTFALTPFISGIQTDSAGESDTVYLQISGTNTLDQYYYWYIQRTTTDSDDFVFPPGEELPTIRYREPVLVQNDSGGISIDINWQLDLEGPEQFRVYLQEEFDSSNPNDEILATQVITINDKYYTVISSGTSSYEGGDNTVDEGATLNITVSGKNIPDTSVTNNFRAPLFYIEHITTSNDDFTVVPPVGAGNAIPIEITNGVGTTSLSFVNDNTTEGTESFKMRLIDSDQRNLTGWYSDNGVIVRVFDTSKTPLEISAIAAQPSAVLYEGVRRGDIFGATISANHVHPFRNDSSVYVAISFNTADSADFANELPGNGGVPRLATTLVSVDGGATAIVTVDSIGTIAADIVDDDAESFNIEVWDELTGGNLLLSGAVAILNINFTLTPSATTVNEGDTVTFDFNITGGAPADGPTGSVWIELVHGTTVDADFTTTPPTSANGRAELSYNTVNSPDGQYSITLAETDLVETDETFTVNVYNKPTGGLLLATSGTITVQDTSPQYSVALFSNAGRTVSATTFNEGDTIYGRVTTSQTPAGETVNISFINTNSDVRFTDTASFVNSASTDYDFTLTIGDNFILGETSPPSLAVRATSTWYTDDVSITVNENDVSPTYSISTYSDAARLNATTAFTEGDTIYGVVTTSGTGQGETIDISFINTGGDARLTDTTSVVNVLGSAQDYNFTLTIGNNTTLGEADPGASIQATNATYDTTTLLISVAEDDVSPTYTMQFFSSAANRTAGTPTTTTFTEGDTIYGILTTAGAAQGETVDISFINGDSRTADTTSVINSASGDYNFELSITSDPVYNADPGASVRATNATYDTEDVLIVINNEAASLNTVTGLDSINDGGTGTNYSFNFTPTFINTYVTVSPYEATATFTLFSNGNLTTFAGNTTPAVGTNDWVTAADQTTGFGDDYQVRILSYSTNPSGFGSGTLFKGPAISGSGSSSNNQGGATAWDNGTNDWFRLDNNFTMSLFVSGTANNYIEQGRYVDIEIKEFDGSNYGTGTTVLQHRVTLEVAAGGGNP